MIHISTSRCYSWISWDTVCKGTVSSSFSSWDAGTCVSQMQMCPSWLEETMRLWVTCDMKLLIYSSLHTRKPMGLHSQWSLRRGFGGQPEIECMSLSANPILWSPCLCQKSRLYYVLDEEWRHSRACRVQVSLTEANSVDGSFVRLNCCFHRTVLHIAETYQSSWRCYNQKLVPHLQYKL
jgi:hypothetical protein